jgi:CDP-glycerol glycerophosphotransferase (TagB/SpsB family)
LYYAVTKITISSSSSVNGYAYHQFNAVDKISGTGIAAVVRVSNIAENNVIYNIPAPIPANKGTIHFNPITKTFEGYNGTDWLPLH